MRVWRAQGQRAVPGYQLVAVLALVLLLAGGFFAGDHSGTRRTAPAAEPARTATAAASRPAPAAFPSPALPATRVLPALASTTVPRPTHAPPTRTAAGSWHVGLQVGHWNMDALPGSLAVLRDQTGTRAAGRSELDLNMDVARRTAALLTRAGVVIDLLPGAIPNDYHADAFVAIHADANFIRRVRGYKVAPPYRSAVAWLDAVLVDALDKAYAQATGLPRDVEITDNMRAYYAINSWMGDDSRIGADTPGAVIETGYMTSAADRAVLFDAPQRVAQGVAQGILAYLQQAGAAAAVEQEARRIAATSPTGCSAVVLLDDTPLRAAPQPDAAAVAWLGRGTVLPYLDSTARPGGRFSLAAGRRLVTETGYYRVAPPGGGPAVYLNRGPAIVQLPNP